MIQWNPDILESPESVAQILTLAENEWDSRRKLYERIRRKKNNSEIVSEDDTTIKVGFEYYINSMVTGYFAGKAPIYDIEKIFDKKKMNIIKKLLNKIRNSNSQMEDELDALIDYIAKYNDDGSEYFELAFDYFGLRACYEVLYENNENEIVYAKQSALNTIGIFDYSTPINQIGQLRRWTEKDKDNNDIIIAELTTINGKKYYQPTPEDKKKMMEIENRAKDSKWKMLPCIAIENDMGLASFELVISIISAYERAIQNSRNTFQYNDEAKLKVTGYEPEETLLTYETDEDGKQVAKENLLRKQEDEALLKAKVFYTPDKDGDIAWIEKNIQDTALQNHKKTLIDLIAMISGVPNITDLGFTTADNASALDRKFFALEQMVTSADKQFKKGILRRWETIINKINSKKKKNYDFRAIKIELQRNLPTDKFTETDRALKLRGLLSDESIIDMLPDGLDSISELAKVNKQKQENISAITSNTETPENQNKKYEIKEGGEDVGISRQEDEGVKKDIQQDKQANTKQATRNI